MLRNSLNHLKRHKILADPKQKRNYHIYNSVKYICGFPQKLNPAGRSSGPQVCEGTLWENKQHFASGLVWTDEADTFLRLRLKVVC